MFLVVKAVNFLNPRVLKNNRMKSNVCFSRSIFKVNRPEINLTKKGPVYFYNLRKKKKSILKNKKTLFNNKLSKSKTFVGKKFKNSFNKKVFIKVLKRPLRDFLLNSQFSKRLSLKNYNKPLFFNFINTARHHNVNAKSNFFFNRRKEIEDARSKTRSAKLMLKKRKKLFFLVFRKIISSKNFFALLQVLKLNVLSAKFSNFNWKRAGSSDDKKSSNFFVLNKKIIIKKNNRGFFKVIRAFHPTSTSIQFFKHRQKNSFENYNSFFLINASLFNQAISNPFFQFSVLYFFKHFIFFFKQLNAVFSKKKFSSTLEAKRHFIFSFNFVLATTFKSIFSKILNSSGHNMPFISAKHFMWAAINSKLFFKRNNNNLTFFYLSGARSNIMFNKNLFISNGNTKNKFLNTYNQTLFNFLYSLLKFRKLMLVLIKNKFFINYFRVYNFKILRAKKQIFDYSLFSSENSPAFLTYAPRKKFALAQLKIWQPQIKKLVPYKANIYTAPLNNLLFSYLDVNSSKKKKKFVSTLRNKYSIFKHLFRTVYTALLKRSFSIAEPLISSSFGTAFRRKYIDSKTSFLMHFLKLMLRSVTKEFVDASANFVNSLKALGFWQFLNYESSLLDNDSTKKHLEKKNNFLNQENGLAINRENLSSEVGFKKFTDLSYLQWLHSVWNVPFVVTKGELLVMNDGKTKRLFLGLDNIPKRALLFNNFEKNNFSMYYSCNALSFFKLFTFYFNLLNPKPDFSNILTRLFNKNKEIAKMKSYLTFYKNSARSNKFNKLNPAFGRNPNFSFDYSLNFSKSWLKIATKYSPRVANFLFFFALKLAFSKKPSRVGFSFISLKNFFVKNVFCKNGLQKKLSNFWKIFSTVHQKFKYFFFRCLKTPFSLVYFPCTSNFKPFFKIDKSDYTLEVVRKFVNSLPSRESYLKLTLSSKKKKTFFSNRFFNEYFAKLSSIRYDFRSYRRNAALIKYSAKAKNCFYTCASVMVLRHFNNRNKFKYAIFKEELVNNKLKLYELAENRLESHFTSLRNTDFDFSVSTKILKYIFGKKPLFRKLYNIYYYKFVVARHLRFKLFASLYPNLLKSTEKQILPFSSNPIESFPQLKSKPRRLFKFNPDAKGRDRVFYYLQKKPKIAHKSNKPFKFLRIYTPRINLSSNLLAVHGVNRHIVERNSRRSTARVARKRKYYLHHIWRKFHNCSSTTLFYKWQVINHTKRKWLTYFLQFENYLSNYIWFTRLINSKKRSESAVMSGLIYVNGNACFDVKYSVRPGDVISLNSEAYNVLTTRRSASYLRRKIGMGSAPVNIKKKFLAKIIRLLQKDVAFGTNAAFQMAPDRVFLISQAAKFLSSDPSISMHKTYKKTAPGGAKFNFSDINNANLSAFDAKRVFDDNAAETSYWKSVITNFYRKLDFSKSHKGVFFYRYKNHLYIRRHPYSAHEWFSSVKKRETDVYNPLNIDTWISHKYWR